MTAYIIRRLFLMVPIVLVISFLVFALMTLAPGDFLDTARGQRDISADTIKLLEKQYGLDRPWIEQYGHWLTRILRGDLGYSWTYKVPVGELIAQRIPATVTLALAALALSWIIALPLGVLAAVRKDSLFDRVTAILSYSAISLPEFFLALLALFFAASTGLFPVGGLTSITSEFLPPPARAADYLWHMTLPTLVLGLGGVAGSLRIMRANFLDSIVADFVTTARAKGLSENVIMFKHVLRNAINPFITSLGFAFSGLLSGALMVENIFNYPGLGQLTYQAFIRQDQFLVLASVVIGASMLIVGNLLADVLLGLSDPRIRLEGRTVVSNRRPTAAFALGIVAVFGLSAALSFLPWSDPGFWKTLKTTGTAALVLAAGFALWSGFPVLRRILPALLRRPVGAAVSAVLALFYGLMLLAPALSPYRPQDQSLGHTFHPPSSYVWKNGGLHLQLMRNEDPTVARYVPEPGKTTPIRWFARGTPYQLFGMIPSDRHLFLVDAPHRIYLLGSDSTGRDVWTRLLYGSRVSLTLGLIGVTVTMTLGFLVGGLAGYLGGTFDNVAMRVVEILMSIPGLYLLIALRSALAQHFDSDEIFVLIVVILSFIGWTGTARVIRGLTLSLRQRPYVLAAEAMGQSRIAILTRHILPNLASYLIISATLSIPAYILGEAALSFLGLGIAEPSASWGLMLSQAQEIKVLMLQFVWLLAPGAAIFIVVLAFNLLGDELRDIIDPKFRLGGRA
ncbi:MAG: ABC transporter permease subunit [Bacteroidia bacterium]|nr:ABC transporter permease subunit [Bacteroidia bacterium]